LRRSGWTLCAHDDGECGQVVLIDARGLDAAERAAVAAAATPAWRLLMLGVDRPEERAALLTSGCAEVLPADVALAELEARARRVADSFGMLPRWRTVGPLTLDLFHRDARRGGRWLALHPREFQLLWRLADARGERVSRQQLLREVWRLNHEPETNSVEVHVSRLRGKLAEHGCERLVVTDPRGGYRLADARPLPVEMQPQVG
jgi:DNA-binding response OmpR family regulator